jgi:predicted helicase
VAWFLASYARDALAGIADVELSALVAVRAALEEALGLKFEGDKGEHFFRSSLVQTLFYGIFSAWVLWSRHNPPTSRKRFDWRLTAWSLRVPMISRLFSLVADPHQLDALKLSEVLDWTGAVLNRVDRASFFSNFEESHAVQYFYEPFLEAFDPELRKQLGVWYTPPEIVKYMVERVDTVLRQELGLPLGLADKNVYVLDPCCGTGSYLVEVLDRIHRTLKERGEDGLTASDLKEAAQKRVFGFEILPAPFVVSHLQLGLLLQKLGVPLVEAGLPRHRGGDVKSPLQPERVAVYLTNSLTGWEPPKGPKQHLIFPEMEQERDAAEYVKQQARILVVLGNPPYNGFAGVAVAEERDLTNAYRTTNRAPVPQGQGLNDLYVRFYRMAERRIVEMSGRGVVCFISNYSWLDGLSFTGMRERYLDAFDRVWIDNLHGDRIISEYAPDGRTSETVFAVQGKSPGIKIGTAIGLLVRDPGLPSASARAILYRDMNQAGAAERTAALVDSLAQRDINQSYAPLKPVLQLGLPFKPRLLSDTYVSWPLLPELFPASFPGVKTSRDDVVVDIDRERLVERMKLYFDPRVSHEEMRRVSPPAMTNTARFKSEAVRDHLRKRGLLEKNIVRYCYRPFDVRWLYWEPETKLLDEKRAEYFSQVFQGNFWLSAGQRNRKEDFYQPQFTELLADHHIVESNVGMFPLYLRSEPEQRQLPSARNQAGTRPNLTESGTSYLGGLAVMPSDAFYHSLALLHSPAYRHENAGALRQDWPRIPLPDSKELLLASAALGRKIAALLRHGDAV